MNKVKQLGDKQHFTFIFITMLGLLGSIRALPSTDPPLNPRHPFLFMWNLLDEECDTKFNSKLNLSLFPIVTSTKDNTINQSLTEFYSNRFGKYPHVDNTDNIHYGGIPQLVDPGHYEAAEAHINYYIPGNQPGLAVLHFEEWRPFLIRNRKDIYQKMSVDEALRINPSMTSAEADVLGRIEYESAAKDYFSGCIRLGKRMRPNTLWGYYLFPECYNEYKNKDKSSKYTGECPTIEKGRNDELLWLWQESTALFPDIYLEKMLRNSTEARLFVRNRIQESMRVSTLPNSNYSIPIYPYIRLMYKDSTDSRLLDFLSEIDLVSTIGEAAALGAAGIISSGDMSITEEACNDAANHLQNILNPYILNVSMASELCSQALCQNRGRCVRKQWDDDVYLHLDPRRFSMQWESVGLWSVAGKLSQDDVDWFDSNFDCMCFSKEPCKYVENQLISDCTVVLLVAMILLLSCQYILRFLFE